LFMMASSFDSGLFDSQNYGQSSNTTEYSNTLSDQGLYQSIVISVVISVCLLLLFTLLRWKFQKFYFPKGQHAKIFSWIPETIKAPQLELFNSFGGYDSVLYLQFLKFSAALFGIFTILGMAILVPVNDVGENKLQGLSRISIANIGQGSHLMFVHLVAVIGFSVCAYIMMFRHYHLATRLHINKLQENKTQYRTVMVSELPNSIKDSNDLLRAFRDLWGHHVVNSSLAIYMINCEHFNERRLKR